MKAIKQYIAISISILLMLQSIIFMVISFFGGCNFSSCYMPYIGIFFYTFLYL